MDSRRSKRKRMEPPKRLVSESVTDLADQSEEEPCSSHTVAKEMAVVHCSDGSDSDAFTGQQSTVKASTKDVSAAPTDIAALKHRTLENNALKIRIDALKDKVLYLESERDYLRIQLAEALALLKMASVKAPVISEVLTPEDAISRYKRVLEAVNKGNNKTAAYRAVGVDRKTIADTAGIAELHAVNPGIYQDIRGTLKKGETLLHFSEMCKAAIKDQHLEGKVQDLKTNGGLLSINPKGK
ncbi:hypothetical protein KUCAC02_025421 [Chaenocephalus aceratus]|uniref:Uncharacterized protein n=1 Tax=Chaenocephalus aceratus TaxID=36190 RepID=A0ACB9VUG5_CHAAC|nr:hypothetical protein KUCAC02_025421 [Chaenocephalus aceratus]